MVEPGRAFLVLKELISTPSAEPSEAPTEDRLVHHSRLGFLDHLVVRKRDMRDNILQPLMEVKDVTACNTGECVETHRMAVGAVRTQAALDLSK